VTRETIIIAAQAEAADQAYLGDGEQGQFATSMRAPAAASALGVAALVALALLSGPALAERIGRVVDGDTVVTARGEKVRLMGFDAPGIRGRCPRERDLARAATATLRRLAAPGLDLERHGRDRHRRTLAVAHTPDGRDVAAVMIGAGLARPSHGRGQRGGWCAPGAEPQAPQRP
jgi:micrococcal nuclease